MLGTADVLKFLISFFLILPIVTFIHLAGHIFFVAIFGGTKRRIVIGSGNKLFSFWKVEIRKYYFWHGACEFVSLKHDNRLTNSLIYLGGSLFNLASIFLVNSALKHHLVDASVFWYQFIYFSFYILFFSLFPMYFSDGSPSDGKAVILSIKNANQDKITDDIQIRNLDEQ